MRIIREAKNLPGHVHLMPPVPGVAPTNEGWRINEGGEPEITIHVEFPDMDPYHLALGRFLDTYGKLELKLHSVARFMIGAGHEVGAAVTSSLSGKSLIDLITTLAETCLPDDHHKELVGLMERLKKINTKRNHLVHGYWAAEVVVYNERDGRLAINVSVNREYMPISKSDRLGLLQRKNQKLRDKYMFSPPRIVAAGVDVDTFHDDLSTFVGKHFPDLTSQKQSL